MLAVTTADAALSASVAEAQFGIRFALSVIATLPALILFARHTPLLVGSLERLQRLVLDVEDDADAEGRVRKPFHERHAPP